MQFLDAIWNILVFIIALTILVMAHEFGHLLFAKKFNVYCYEYSIGMGPVIASRKKGETKYSVKAFPIGGSVLMAGEEMDSKTKEELGELFNVDVPIERTLYGIKKWKRLLVVGGGALFNFILGMILVFLVVNIENEKVNTNSSKIKVQEASQIYDAGVRTNDEIYKIDIELKGNGDTKSKTFEIKRYADITDALSDSDYVLKTTQQVQSVTFYYYRYEGDSKKAYQTNAIDRACNTTCSDITPFGFTVTTSKLSVGDRFVEPLKRFGEYSLAVFRGLGRLLTGAFGDVSGPIGILSYSSEVATYGFLTYLSFIALLSINLGIFNLVPFPGLDGSTIFITIGEMITRKELPKNVKSIINFVGIIILLSLIVLVSIKDIIALI